MTDAVRPLGLPWRVERAGYLAQFVDNMETAAALIDAGGRGLGVATNVVTGEAFARSGGAWTEKQRRAPERPVADAPARRFRADIDG